MRSFSFVLFFLVLTGLLALANRYAWRWLHRAFAVPAWASRGLALLLGAALFGMLAGRIVERLWSGAPVRSLLLVSSIIELSVLLSVAALLVLDALRLASRTFARVWRVRSSKRSPSTAGGHVPEPSGDAEASRRSVLVQGAVSAAFVCGTGSSLYGALRGRHDYAIEEVPVRIPGLASALDGFSIVQLSDIHIGQFVGQAELSAAVDLVRRAKPDLIVLTGDLLDHDPRLALHLGEFARKIQSLAREGVVAISGNHDFYAGIDATVTALERGGADVLRNRGRVIGEPGAGFALLGVDDVWARRFNPLAGPNLSQAVQSLPRVAGRLAGARDLPRILLCHNPSYFEHAAGQVALQLSGHTHGGQINPLVRPANWLLKNGWVAGLYERDGSRLYVNRGFGTVGPPARIGAPPEVTRIVLVSA